jgi:23S rRNA (pseudouridine1915-N3)-methyltransferase
MKIKIITISKTKSEYSDLEKEFLKRLQKYAKIEVLNIKEEPITKNRSHDDIKAIEGEKLVSKIDQDAFIVVLDDKGKQFTSQEFAKQIEQIRDFKGAKMNFIIGGPLGLSGEVLGRANLVLSLSKMTLTHQMIRLLLLEQIYRGFEILKGTEYHK